MNPYVLVEGRFDRRVLEPLIADLGPVELHEVGSLPTMRPKASAVLSVRRVPTAMIFDADAVGPMVSEQLDTLTTYFQGGPPGVPFLMVAWEPTLERLFFDAPSALEAVLGRPLTPMEHIAGTYGPKPALEHLLGARWRELLLAKLPAHLGDLRAHPKIAELRAFLQSAQPVAAP